VRLGLLAITGIWTGEVVGLDDGDFDARPELLLVVRSAEYCKHRLVPLHPSAVQALARYAGLRRQAHPFPASPALFISTAGTQLLHSNISLTFASLAERAGLTRRSSSCRPRVHDLRHSLAVATVLG
jgi:integrase/recombinase XerD